MGVAVWGELCGVSYVGGCVGELCVGEPCVWELCVGNCGGSCVWGNCVGDDQSMSYALRTHL